MMKQRYADVTRLNHHDQQRSDFKKLMPIVKEALLHKMWLYNSNSGNWYSPEEFQAAHQNREYTNYEIRSILENTVIRNPRAGIKAYYKELEDRLTKMEAETRALREKGEEFTRKVMAYYQDKSK
jgi:hypothetical protein